MTFPALTYREISSLIDTEVAGWFQPQQLEIDIGDIILQNNATEIRNMSNFSADPNRKGVFEDELKRTFSFVDKGEAHYSSFNKSWFERLVGSEALGGGNVTSANTGSGRRVQIHQFINSFIVPRVTKLVTNVTLDQLEAEIKDYYKSTITKQYYFKTQSKSPGPKESTNGQNVKFLAEKSATC